MTDVPAAVLDRVLERADRAPSVHGTKPWWWQRTPSGLELYIRPERHLTTTDPVRRDLTISCGAALYSLEVAAAAEGWRARPSRVPDPTLQSLLATVQLEPHEATPESRAHADLLDARRIDRRAGPPGSLPAGFLQEVVEIARGRGVLVAATEGRDHEVLALLAEAARVQALDRDYRRELEAWGQRRRPIDPRDTDATWVVLATTSDDRLSWLRTGEALQAVWLWSVGRGLNVMPHSQAIEVPSVRARLQDELLQDRSCPQLVLRIGWAASNAGQPPR